MSRKTSMAPTLNVSGGGLGRRVVVTLVALVLLAMVVRDPVGMAQSVQNSAAWASDVIAALSSFGSALSR